METKTLFRILREKFLLIVEEATFQEIYTFIFKAILFVFFSFLLVNIEGTFENLKKAAFFNEFAPLKVILIFFLVFFYTKYIKAFKSLKKYVLAKFEKIGQEETLSGKVFFGIPIFELVDYLFTKKTFKREEVEIIFSLPRNRFDVMAKLMDSVGIFIRWENNGRIINPSFSRSDVVSILESFDGEKLFPLTRETSENTFTHKPSMEEIIERNSPSPEERFIKKPLYWSIA